MRKLLTLTLTLMLLSFAANARASVVPLLSGLYEVNYTFDIKGGTLFGGDITDIFIYETDGVQISVDSVFTAAGSGPSTISHQIAFDPTLSLLIGLDRAPSGSVEGDHLVIFMSEAFAEDALTKDKFSTIFPAVDGRPRIGHNQLVQALKDAQQNDAGAISLMADFFTVDAGKFATFDPRGSLRVLEFSPPVAIDVVPEPASMFLFGAGAVGAFLRRRKV